MLKLNLQHFGCLMWRTNSLYKILILGKIEGRRRGWQRMRWWWHHRHDGHEFKQTPGVGNGQGSLVCCSPWGLKELYVTVLTDTSIKKYIDPHHFHSCKLSWHGIFFNFFFLSHRKKYVSVCIYTHAHFTDYFMAFFYHSAIHYDYLSILLSSILLCKHDIESQYIDIT